MHVKSRGCVCACAYAHVHFQAPGHHPPTVCGAGKAGLRANAPRGVVAPVHKQDGGLVAPVAAALLGMQGQQLQLHSVWQLVQSALALCYCLCRGGGAPRDDPWPVRSAMACAPRSVRADERATRRRRPRWGWQGGAPL